MQRIAIGATVAIATWLGSGLVAMAQTPTIQPTGPLSVYTGSSSSTFTATVTLSAPSGFRVRLWVYRNGTQFHYSETLIPNPGTTTYYFSRAVSHTLGASLGDTFKYSSKLLVGTQTITAADWIVIVTNPPTKLAQVEKRPSLILQGADRDRRRE